MRPFVPPLLGVDEPAPYRVINATGTSAFVIVVDHASASIPRSLSNLGLPPAELARHIAWDIGALAVASVMSTALDAPLIAQNYSRLVIDCNRDPGVDSSIPGRSESSDIPGNLNLSAEEINARRAEVFEPYHAAIRALLDARLARGKATILVAQHSMTHCYAGVSREMHAAVLYNRDRRFAGLLLEALRRESGLLIADNEPYFVSDETDYTVPRHAEARNLPYVEIEIRQDLLLDAAGQDAWAERITAALQVAAQAFFALPTALMPSHAHDSAET